MVNPSEHIQVDSWEKLAARIAGPVVYRTTDQAAAFFKEVSGTGRQVVLVTACSDAGVHIQDTAHPNGDLFKLAASVDWSELAARRDGYHGVQVGPACVGDRCYVLDRYSLKTERFTWATFDQVPDEVTHWFTTNLDCDCPRAELIPFGLNDDGPGASMLPRFMGREKTGLLYVNFQNNSLDRVRLKQHYKDVAWLTYRHEANLPVETYLEEMAAHKFVLAPPGNGLDCYRLWEALYLGCIPILQDSYFARRVRDMGLPVVLGTDLFSLTPSALDEIWNLKQAKAASVCWGRAGLSYWKDRLLAL